MTKSFITGIETFFFGMVMKQIILPIELMIDKTTKFQNVFPNFNFRKNNQHRPNDRHGEN
jgi:hypothetical protein